MTSPKECRQEKVTDLNVNISIHQSFDHVDTSACFFLKQGILKMNQCPREIYEPSQLCDLPANDDQRWVLRNEIHTRPSATFKLPALIVYVAVLNSSITIADELAHLKGLPGHDNLNLEQLKGNFLQLQCKDFKVIWERHTEFTRYTIVQALPPHATWGTQLPNWRYMWPQGLPGSRPFQAKPLRPFELAMLNEGMDDPDAIYKSKQWLGEGAVIGSKMGRTAVINPTHT
jgi:hypothetical protein